jgi:AraC-like DNA-binding protein
LTIDSFIEDLGKIIVFLMILLSIFLITVKSSKKLSNYLFASFLLITSIDFLGLFLGVLNNPILQGIKIASVLLQMPLYYLYIQSVCYYNFKLKIKHFLHVILYIIFTIYFIKTSISETSLEVYYVITKIQYYFYIVAVFITLSKFKKLYKENYASNHQTTYKWLFQTTIFFLIGNSFVLLRSFILTNNTSQLLDIINLIISVFALFVICWFVLKALYQPNLFIGIDINIKPQELRNNNLLENKEDIDKLSKYMDDEKPYLDPEINLQKLASAINLSDKQLSQIINQYLNKHFFDYINTYRINDAKRLLKDKNLTVLEVLYDVGFNSKSSFYTAFKKETNTTPTVYRK